MTAILVGTDIIGESDPLTHDVHPAFFQDKMAQLCEQYKLLFSQISHLRKVLPSSFLWEDGRRFAIVSVS